MIGTPRYMAPEQAQGATSKLDRQADVYSLGATLYHLLTGQPAIPGETVAEVIHNLIENEPRPLRAHDPGIPVDLEAIVLKCLEKDRSARYDSARALADDLGRFLNGEPVLARPVGSRRAKALRLSGLLPSPYLILPLLPLPLVLAFCGLNQLAFIAPLAIALFAVLGGEYGAGRLSRTEGDS